MHEQMAIVQETSAPAPADLRKPADAGRLFGINFTGLEFRRRKSSEENLCLKTKGTQPPHSACI
jgi:hypothetical protein